MVKGISKQVIVVRQPDAKLFEQAIFLLREDALGAGVSDEELLRQANRAANRYLQSAGTGSPRRLWPKLAWMLAGAGATLLIWLGTVLL